MMIAHLPAGYLLAKATQTSGWLFAGIVAGSILPDFDMLWFHFIDHGAVHHHDYLTHRPILWVAVLLVGLVLSRALIIGVGLGAIFHLTLDSIAGKVTWGWPFWDKPTTLIIVPATHDNWVMSFLHHWTFRVELAIFALALCVFLYSWRKARN